MAKKSMVIVESPAKARTIGRYLGKSYFVRASMGHVRDLPQKRMGVLIDKDFQPEYRVMPSRLKTVNALKRESAKADKIFLATDLDREGEAIAWHLAHALEIDEGKAFRVVFNQITKPAIIEAFKHPGRIDMAKVNAQQARRILDRIVGYKISPLLWKKVARGLSAGRVQSVIVRLIVEREKEIEAFEPREFWRITADLLPQKAPRESKFQALVSKIDGKEAEIPDEETAQKLVEELRGAAFVVEDVKKTKRVSKAPPPFKTSTLQQAASTQLRFSASRTMRVAQQLYEGIELGAEGAAGLITYMRTDSLHVSAQAIADCRDLIPKTFGKNYMPDTPNRFKTPKGAQAAHEAIRPTSVARTPEAVKPYLTADQFKLYDLIWRRFVASQMKPAVFALTDVTVAAGRIALQAKGRQTLFEGHQVLAPHSKAKEDQPLPDLEAGQPLDLLELSSDQHFTKPPPRYTEATLVREMERLGIGRPSTYAPIIATIQKRGYVRQKDRAFYAAELGVIVTERLVKHFSDIMDVKFTSHMEADLDHVEEGRRDWVELLREFYGPFQNAIEKAEKEMEHATENETTDEKCELCGSPMVVKFSKRGKFLSCSAFPKCRNTRSLEAPPEQTDEKCEKCGSPMVVRTGRRGKFLGCSAYPKCDYTRPIGPKEPPRETGEVCEKCGKPMVIRTGRRGRFIACSGFPECRNTKPLKQGEGKDDSPNAELTGENCEKCGKPMVVRTGPKGKFAACSGYPECRNTKPLTEQQTQTSDTEPTDQACEKCGSPMVLRKGRYGPFLACSAYPKCRNTKKISQAG